MDGTRLRIVRTSTAVRRRKVFVIRMREAGGPNRVATFPPWLEVEELGVLDEWGLPIERCLQCLSLVEVLIWKCITTGCIDQA